MKILLNCRDELVDTLLGRQCFSALFHLPIVTRTTPSVSPQTMLHTHTHTHNPKQTGEKNEAQFKRLITQQLKYALVDRTRRQHSCNGVRMAALGCPWSCIVTSSHSTGWFNKKGEQLVKGCELACCSDSSVEEVVWVGLCEAY